MTIKSWCVRSVVLSGIFVFGSALAQSTDEVMICGASNATPDLLFGPGVYNIVSSCTPTPSTTAMLVSRDGTVDGPAWLTYLNSGGVIITEFSIADDVYNGIYNTAIPQGGFVGACSDGIPPGTKLNVTHPFWQANNIVEALPAEQGCGYDLSAIVSADPLVTSLGEYNPGQIMFAIRPQGAGTLFLLEADWQDGSPSGYLENSRQMMNAMVNFVGAAPQVASIPSLSAVGLLLLTCLMGFFGRRGMHRA